MIATRFLAVLALALGLLGGAHAQFVAVPPLNSHVTDLAGMLSPAERQRLEAQLADEESRTGSQIAILLVASTAPEGIEQYSIRVTDAWKLGRKGVDDGVLLLVARDNPPALRRLRIEAGRGVQGALTDAQSKRILQDVIAPQFRQNQFYAGLSAGATAIATLINGEKFPAPSPNAGQQAKGQASAHDGGGLPWPLILFGVIVLFSIFRPRRGARLARGGWGSGATGFILGNALGGLDRGGVGGGGFGGGGGFSGGGGSFDGGGASGNW